MEINYKTTALLEVDIQNDFCPAYTGKNGKKHPVGALAVNNGHKIITQLNKMAKIVQKNGGKVLATQDWHSNGHISFATSHKGKKAGEIIIIPVSEKAVESFNQQFPDLTDPIPAAMQQVLWPDHCVQNTEGAAFHDKLDTSLIDFVFRKGYNKNIDSYSAFFENDRCTPTDLNAYLKEQNIDTIMIGGIATDYCVLYTVIDAIRLGFKAYVLEDACMGIDTPPGSIAKAVSSMKERGAVFISTTDFK
ncbi:MAG: nicotinamidase [Treponema sp.]|nr:nicotinamidase [Treponema sp.]